MRRHVMRRGVSTLGRALFLAAVAAAMLVGGAPAAQAHDGLAGSTPAQAATVPTPPSEIELEFTGPPQTLGAEVAVTGPDGATVSDGAAEVSGTTVVQPLATGLPAGDYTVDWRVVSSDGHPLTGTFSFTATEGAAPAQAVPSDDAAPTTSGAAAPAFDTPGPTLAAQPEEASRTGTAGSAAATVWIALAAVLVLGLAGAVAFWRLRGRP